MTRTEAQQFVGCPLWQGYGLARWLVVLQAVRPRLAVPPGRPRPQALVWKRIKRTGTWTTVSEAWLEQLEPAELTPEVLGLLRSRPSWVRLAPDVEAKVAA